MTRRWLLAAVRLALAGALVAGPSLASPPTAKARPGTAFEKLILENQDLSLLREDERHSRGPVPPWLKVVWRKAHPGRSYTANDPTGGYPHVLKEVLEWMESHQDLEPGRPEIDVPPGRDDDVPTVGDAARAASGRATVPEVRTAGPNVRVSGEQASPRSESDIRVNYWNPGKIVCGSNNLSGSGLQAQFYSTDGGATWGQTTLPLHAAGGDAFHSDPTVDWTSDGTAWATTVGISRTGTKLRLRSYRSTDSGATWTWEATPSGEQTGAEKQMMWVDHSAASPHQDNIYLVWHDGNPVYVNRRDPGGWLPAPVRVSGPETTGTGLGSDVKTNSAGDVHAFWPDTGSRRIFMVKSTDGGTSFGPPVRIATTWDSYDIGVPSFNGRRALVYVSGGAYRTATKDNVYAVWTDLTGGAGCANPSSEPGSSTASSCKTRIWFARSTNGGSGWEPARMINDSPGRSDQFNPWLVVDETNGAIGIAYYDTVADTGRRKTDVWYQSSFDDGATFGSALKVTTAQTDETVSGADSGSQYGDYNGLSGYQGVFFPSWSDRRNTNREEIWTAKVTDPVVGGTTTWSISGSAGTSIATVAACSLSTTSDASGEFTISGLSNGPCVVTPAKTGCRFDPASRSVTISSGDVTGVTFTASCGRIRIPERRDQTHRPVPTNPTTPRGPKIAGPLSGENDPLR